MRVKQTLAIAAVSIIIAGGAMWYEKLSFSVGTTKPAVSEQVKSSSTIEKPAQPQVKPSLEEKPVNDQDKEKALDLYNTGLELYYDRNFSQATYYFDQAISIDQGCYHAINGKGAAYAFEGRYDEGINLIRQAIQMNPSFEYAQFNLGLANELAGRWDTAIEAYEKAIQMNSKDEWAYYGIASIYGRQGKATEVVQYLKQAIAINHDCKLTAREEQDFNPVRNSPEFKTLIE